MYLEIKTKNSKSYTLSGNTRKTFYSLTSGTLPSFLFQSGCPHFSTIFVFPIFQLCQSMHGIHHGVTGSCSPQVWERKVHLFPCLIKKIHKHFLTFTQNCVMQINLHTFGLLDLPLLISPMLRSGTFSWLSKHPCGKSFLIHGSGNTLIKHFL